MKSQMPCGQNYFMQSVLGACKTLKQFSVTHDTNQLVIKIIIIILIMKKIIGNRLAFPEKKPEIFIQSS